MKEKTIFLEVKICFDVFEANDYKYIFNDRKMLQKIKRQFQNDKLYNLQRLFTDISCLEYVLQ